MLYPLSYLVSVLKTAKRIDIPTSHIRLLSVIPHYMFEIIRSEHTILYDQKCKTGAVHCQACVIWRDAIANVCVYLVFVSPLSQTKQA